MDDEGGLLAYTWGKREELPLNGRRNISFIVTIRRKGKYGAIIGLTEKVNKIHDIALLHSKS